MDRSGKPAKPSPRQTPPLPSRVDDSLPRRFALRRQIQQALREEKTAGADIASIRRIERRIAALPEYSPDVLLDAYLESDAEISRLALMAMAESKDRAAFSRLLEERLSLPDLPDDKTRRLTAAKAIVDENPDWLMQRTFQQGKDLRHLSAETASLLLDYVQSDVAAMIWVEQFAGLEAEEKRAALDMFMARPRREFLGIAWCEADSDNPLILETLAAGLADYPYPETIPVLERIARGGHEPARRAALESLSILRANLPDLPSGTAGPEPLSLAAGRFYRAYVAEDRISHQCSVVYAKIDEQNQICFCVALIDRSEQGLVDVWGNVRFSAKEFDDLIQGFSEPGGQRGDFQFEPAERDCALSLLRRAEALSSQRGHRPPNAWKLWRALIDSEPPGAGECDLDH